MKYSWLIFLFSFTSCLNNSDGIEAPSHNIIETPAVSEVNNDDIDDRGYWQKPDLVIEKLGNLENKVVADIGAGLGYFSFELANRNAQKVIATDIDPEKIEWLNIFKNKMKKDQSNFDDRFEVRQVSENDSGLNDNELDAILIVNTIAYIKPLDQYLKNLLPKLRENGKLVIVDFKTKRIPDHVNAPTFENRIYLHELEEAIQTSGFSKFESDDTSLDYQFIIVATK